MSDRKVHFSVPIHQIEYLDKQWETASRLARDGSDWLRMGLDRQRFKDRIDRTAELLDKILDFEFRQHIYQERFENFVIPEQQALKAATTKQFIEPTSAPYHQKPSQSAQQKETIQQNKGRRRRKGKKRPKHRGRHRKKK